MAYLNEPRITPSKNPAFQNEPRMSEPTPTRIFDPALACRREYPDKLTLVSENRLRELLKIEQTHLTHLAATEEAEAKRVKRYTNERTLRGGVIAVRYENGVRLGDYLRGDDGYYMFWPDMSRSGAWPGYLLQEIGSRLDELNTEWDREVSMKGGA